MEVIDEVTRNTQYLCFYVVIVCTVKNKFPSTYYRDCVEHNSIMYILYYYNSTYEMLQK